MDNVSSPDFASDKEGLLRGLKFGTPDMDKIIKHIKPTLCVFDPVQGFVPPEINMGSRNAMRDCTAPLISLGEETGTTFLVICHTNKRKGASGRDRIADSADLWDVSRSVIMMGFTDEQGIRYLSNEKNNYTKLQETILFKVTDEGHVEKTGSTWKRDREYQGEHALSTGRPKMDDCKEWVFNELVIAGGKIKTKDLDEKAKATGYSIQTYKTAKTEMRSEGLIDFEASGSARMGNREWYTIIPVDKSMEQLPENTPVPFK